MQSMPKQGKISQKHATGIRQNIQSSSDLPGGLFYFILVNFIA